VAVLLCNLTPHLLRLPFFFLFFCALSFMRVIFVFMNFYFPPFLFFFLLCCRQVISGPTPCYLLRPLYRVACTHTSLTVLFSRFTSSRLFFGIDLGSLRFFNFSLLGREPSPPPLSEQGFSGCSFRGLLVEILANAPPPTSFLLVSGNRVVPPLSLANAKVFKRSIRGNLGGPRWCHEVR